MIIRRSSDAQNNINTMLNDIKSKNINPRETYYRKAVSIYEKS